MSRIARRFAELSAAQRAAFIPFITAGDPDRGTSFDILRRLPERKIISRERFRHPIQLEQRIAAIGQSVKKNWLHFQHVIEVFQRPLWLAQLQPRNPAPVQ